MLQHARQPNKQRIVRATATSTIALLALLAFGRVAAAQAHPERMLEDAETFRAALGAPIMNAIIRTAHTSDVVRWRPTAQGVVVTEGELLDWFAGDETLPMEYRVAGALLALAPLQTSVAELGFRLDVAPLGMEVFQTGEFVQRIGGRHASVTLEPGTSRPREVWISSGDIEYRARAMEYGDVGRGWYPTVVSIDMNGVRVAWVEVTDMARSTADLAPLAGTVVVGARGNGDPVIAFPRLPL